VSIGAGCAILGLAGLTYVGGAMLVAGRIREYQPVGEDWLWHGAFPILAYVGFLIVAVVVCAGHVVWGLRVLAADTVFILLTAIHNAWDAATWVALSASRRKRDDSSDVTDSDTPGTA